LATTLLLLLLLQVESLGDLVLCNEVHRLVGDVGAVADVQGPAGHNSSSSSNQQQQQ
jgi:hypothetical protein